MRRRKVSERLIERLREELKLDIPADAKLRNNHAGHWQRDAGAWIWEADFGSRFSGRQIGSQWTMMQCLKAKKLIASPGYRDGLDTYIDPDPEPPFGVKC